MQTNNRIHNGITLIEVLASIFVVSIGLLGVLAVIPFGAFQFSKANHAEYASNMLANAADEIFIRDMAKLKEWGFDIPSGAPEVLPTQTFNPGTRRFPFNINGSSGNNSSGTITAATRIFAVPRIYTLLECYGIPVLMRIDIHVESVTEISVSDNGDTYTIDPQHLPESIHSLEAVNCTRFIWFEPHEAVLPVSGHIFPLPAFKPDGARAALIRKWAEPMCGQDDLLYTTYDYKRPDFEGQNNKIQSSGKYTWFFTFLPQPIEGWTDGIAIAVTPPPIAVPIRSAGQDYSINLGTTNIRVQLKGRETVPLECVRSTVDADILACYNRVREDDQQTAIPHAGFSASAKGGTFMLPNASYLDLLSQTKYIFVTWGTATVTRAPGAAWCKIVFVDKSQPASPKIIVTGNLPNTNNNMHVYIPSGVQYRYYKQLEGVPVR